MSVGRQGLSLSVFLSLLVLGVCGSGACLSQSFVATSKGVSIKRERAVRTVVPLL